MSFYLGGPQRWTSSDRALVRAWHEHQSHLCSGCGTHRESWRDPGDYEVSFIRCPACLRLENAPNELPKGSETAGLKAELRVSARVVRK